MICLIFFLFFIRQVQLLLSSFFGLMQHWLNRLINSFANARFSSLYDTNTNLVLMSKLRLEGGSLRRYAGTLSRPDRGWDGRHCAHT
jgi:hypothetical protein